MFGFLTPDYSDRQVLRRYRQIYASFCSYHRSRFGLAASALLSYEAIFLLQLAVESGACQPPSPCTPTCCRLRSDPTNRWGIDRELADYCSAFGVLLAKIKIEDDLQDRGGWLPYLSSKVLKRAFHDATVHLERAVPGLSAKVEMIVRQHGEVEARDWAADIEQYAEKTREGFAMLFEGFARSNVRLKFKQADLSAIGAAIGNAIIAVDCCEDLAMDRRTGQYNPITSPAEFGAARLFALQNIVDAGFRCAEFNRSTHQSITVTTLRRAFWRAAKLRYPSQQQEALVAGTAGRRFRRLSMARRANWVARHAFRTGDCDCGGCDCDACGGDACGGCDGLGICDAGEPSAGDSCCNGRRCYGCGCDACCDSCGDRDRKAGSLQNENHQGDSPNSEAHRLSSNIDGDAGMLNSTGVALTALSPSGVVVIEGVEYPAQSQSGFVDAGAEVKVIRKETFGWIVARVQ